MVKLSKDLVVRLDDIEYEKFQLAVDLFETNGVSYIGCDSGYSLIDYSSEVINFLVESESIDNSQGLEIKRLNPDKILVVCT